MALFNALSRVMANILRVASRSLKFLLSAAPRKLRFAWKQIALLCPALLVALSLVWFHREGWCECSAYATMKQGNSTADSNVSPSLECHRDIRSNELFRSSVLSENLMAVKTNLHPSASSVGSACVVEPLLECKNIGFSALLLLTMEQLAYCHHVLKSTPTVKWRNCNSVCSKNPQFNSWGWYFELVSPGVEFMARKVVCVALVSVEVGGRVWLGGSFRRRGLPAFNDSALITSETRRDANDIIRRYIKPNKNITRIVDDFYIKNLRGNNLLGVHVRGTDHAVESRAHVLAPLDLWINEAREILDSMPAPSKIFVAGDNHEALVAFQKAFGKNKVFFTKAFRAKSYRQSTAPHDAKNAEPHPRRFGSEVLIDILLLAKCQHFLHAEASVSTLATFFNPDIKSHFLGELSPKVDQKFDVEDATPRDEPACSLDEFGDCKADEISEHEDCFIENGPASTCPNMAAARIAWDGVIIPVGFASGDIPQIPANILLVKNCSAAGLFWGAHMKANPAVLRESVDKTLQFIEQGKLKGPHVSAVFGLEQVNEAFKFIMQRKSAGKVVVKMR